MGGIPFDCEILYSGSIDGWTLSDFHKRCDNKGTTVSFFKQSKKDGSCIGGLTNAQWSSPMSSTPSSDNKAVLFNLTQ